VSAEQGVLDPSTVRKASREWCIARSRKRIDLVGGANLPLAIAGQPTQPGSTPQPTAHPPWTASLWAVSTSGVSLTCHEALARAGEVSQRPAAHHALGRRLADCEGVAEFMGVAGADVYLVWRYQVQR
jgi:hypothetical protein